MIGMIFSFVIAILMSLVLIYGFNRDILKRQEPQLMIDYCWFIFCNFVIYLVGISFYLSGE